MDNLVLTRLLLLMVARGYSRYRRKDASEGTVDFNLPTSEADGMCFSYCSTACTISFKSPSGTTHDAVGRLGFVVHQFADYKTMRLFGGHIDQPCGPCVMDVLIFATVRFSKWMPLYQLSNECGIKCGRQQWMVTVQCCIAMHEV